jgi:hypothetical protein
MYFGSDEMKYLGSVRHHPIPFTCQRMQ